MSNQAVGGTMEHNPISIIPPATASRGQRQFERVIEKKIQFHEGADMGWFFTPAKSTAP